VTQLLFTDTTNEYAQAGHYFASRNQITTDLLCIGIDVRECLRYAALSLGYSRAEHHLPR
jgi:hypothetical protein